VKLLKIALLLVAVYIGIVVIFESMLGYFQPETQTTLIIKTQNSNGQTSNRVLQQLTSDGQIYVAANHWPRAWYKDALAQPDLMATINGVTASYHVTAVSDAEHERLSSEFAPSIWFKVLTGFPPRRFVRLDPR